MRVVCSLRVSIKIEMEASYIHERMDFISLNLFKLMIPIHAQPIVSSVNHILHLTRVRQL